MQQSSIIRDNGITYITDEVNKTASVKSCSVFSSDIIIPSSIIVGSIKYIVTSISEGAFKLLNKIKSIQFDPGSKLQTIEKDAFHGSTIESITLPSSLVDLKDGWCSYTSNLVKIIVNPENPYFKIHENKYLLKKSSLEKEDYDILLFCFRSVKTAMIPDFVEIIGSHAFEEIEKVEMTSNSKLRIIGNSAFSFSQIESITFSHHLTDIYDQAFFCCYNLKQIVIPPNCEIRTIGKEAFYKTSIKKFLIPLHLTKICERAFYCCQKLHKIETHFNSNLQIIEKEAFFESQIEYFTIPSHITKICEKAFSSCKNLLMVKIESNSNLQIIEDYAFNETSIESLVIPDKLVSIGEQAFNDCKKLRKIDISPNSELTTIRNYAFCESAIVSFFIPRHLINFGSSIFYYSKLKIIEIDENTEITHLKLSIFNGCNNIIIMISKELSTRFNLC